VRHGLANLDQLGGPKRWGLVETDQKGIVSRQGPHVALPKRFRGDLDFRERNSGVSAVSDQMTDIADKVTSARILGIDGRINGNYSCLPMERISPSTSSQCVLGSRTAELGTRRTAAWWYQDFLSNSGMKR
jgi:hypothetical protein